MTPRDLGTVVHELRRVLLRREHKDLTDAELLDSFVTQRDEVTFEVLVRRHGPMVIGVCRRILHIEADVEDAFQATFLVLVQKAASIRPRALVGNWLWPATRR
jgi:DNA-directed RNA polymerase specialized sigma24 family protein